MTNLKTVISATIGIVALATTAPVNAQSSNVMMPEANPVTMWTLAKTSEKLTIALQTTPHTHAMMTPWVKDSSLAISPINTPQYTPANMRDFDYNLTAPIKLSVGKRYQRQLAANLPQKADYLVTRTSDSNPYEVTTYEVASTATIGFNLQF